MGLRITLETAHKTLISAGVDHALIGGMGLATLGIHRATEDVDLIVESEQKEIAKKALQAAGFQLRMETDEVMHFEGIGRLDLPLARRPLSKQMLANAQVYPQHGLKCVSPEGMIGLKIQAYKNDKRRELQDKADIKAIIDKCTKLNWDLVKTYADLFGEWKFVESLRSVS